MPRPHHDDDEPDVEIAAPLTGVSTATAASAPPINPLHQQQGQPQYQHHHTDNTPSRIDSTTADWRQGQMGSVDIPPPENDDYEVTPTMSMLGLLPNEGTGAAKKK